jgi:Fe-S-cluster-containing hydrogenase component 2
MSLWQSLLFGFNHKCGYCQAICPAGTYGMSQYAADKKAYVQQVAKPLKDRVEPVYVVAGSHAEIRVKSNSRKNIRFAKLSRPIQQER